MLHPFPSDCVCTSRSSACPQEQGSSPDQSPIPSTIHSQMPSILEKNSVWIANFY